MTCIFLPLGRAAHQHSINHRRDGSRGERRGGKKLTHAKAHESGKLKTSSTQRGEKGLGATLKCWTVRAIFPLWG